MELIPIIDGYRSQFERLSVERAARALASAHRQSLSWDCRVATSGQSYRPLNDREQKILIEAIKTVL
jgi:hypothetical protein